MNFVYVLKSQQDGKRYIGLTNNLEKRLRQHNSGKVKSTKNRRPFSLVYYEEFEDRSEAAQREKFFKTGKGREFLNNKLMVL
ncbi:MAG TPA: GIY-YIG nuclease family protein [Ignavibacteria bacterium]|nr:GIY-YIG nuclease family protein [Ignavibacteria bacterium]